MKKLHKILLGLSLPASLAPLSGFISTDADNSQFSLKKSSTEIKGTQSIHLLNLGESLTEEIKEAQKRTPETSFASFKQKFPNKESFVKGFQPIDVYNLLSGWKDAISSFLDKVVELQKKIEEANKIFNTNIGNQIDLPEDENPNVLNVLGSYGGEGFFPTLGKNGLNLPQQIFENFTDFKVVSHKIHDFQVSLVGERDIIKNDKVRFSYAVQIPLNLELLVNNQKVTFNITVDLRTNNFSTQETFNELFNKCIGPVNWQFFSRVKVDKLHYDQTDATHLANTLLQDQFNALNLDLEKSIYDLELPRLEAEFQQKYVDPLIEKKQRQKAEWEEAERIRKEEEEKHQKELEEQQRIQAEKAKNDEQLRKAQTELKKALGGIDSFVEFFTNNDLRLKLAYTKEDNVRTRAGLFRALEVSFGNYRAWTFYITLLGWKDTTEKIFKKAKWQDIRDDEKFRKAFGLSPKATEKDVGKVTNPGYGYQGIYIKDSLRDGIAKYSDSTVSEPKNVKVSLPGTVGDNEEGKIWIASHNFRQNHEWGAGEKFKYSAYRFKFDVTVDYDVEVSAKWWTWAFRGSIPGYWRGKFKVTYSFDGVVPSWKYGHIQVRTPQYSFNKQEQKILFVPHAIQKIAAEGSNLDLINPFLKDQKLDEFEHYHPDLTKPLDLVAYLLYAITTRS